MAATVRCARVVSAPARVICVCHQAPKYMTDECDSVAGLVEINGTMYLLRPLGHQSNEGYRMQNIRNGNVYDIDTSSGKPICDCADCTYREHACKHCVALQRLRNDRVI